VISPNVQDSLRERFARSNRKVLSRYVRDGHKQFRFRDLSSESGRYSTSQLVEVFEMIDQWRSLGGPEFVGERMIG
jgi:hypothetical protein